MRCRLIWWRALTRAARVGLSEKALLQFLFPINLVPFSQEHIRRIIAATPRINEELTPFALITIVFSFVAKNKSRLDLVQRTNVRKQTVGMLVHGKGLQANTVVMGQSVSPFVPIVIGTCLTSLSLSYSRMTSIVKNPKREKEAANLHLPVAQVFFYRLLG
ncbi:hypothetical protein C8J56DRAFT_1050636 [Mycena floridula]|nr:hypothetical protein C8J56DRAFT_1050636 [Mycena floridula]